MRPAALLLQCRAGFERECAQEVTAVAAGFGVSGFVRARPDSGYAVFQPHEEAALEGMRERLSFADLVFARQVTWTAPLLSELPEADRAGPIARAARALGKRFRSLWLEMPDTNEGKALATLARPLAPHLAAALEREGVTTDAGGAPHRLQVFFVGGRACHVGVGDPDNAAPWPMGIPRLRMPGSAPSRSTLKLAEALLVFFDDRQREALFAPGMTAVDLGASPGGWTWQLVRRQMHVTAVDNGAIDAALLDTGQVKHRREDAFGYRPPVKVDWMVCDMVESPARVARLAAQWVAQGWSSGAIFNLKLPMKKRWEETLRCRELLEAGLGDLPHRLRLRQLYHDREEVTACIVPRGPRR